MRSLGVPHACLLVALLSPALLPADQIRGLIVEEIRVPSSAEYEKTVGISLEEAAVLMLEEETPFLEGIKIELHLSNVLKQYFDSYALAVYKNLVPRPQPSIRFYEGDRAFFQYLPYLNRIYVQIPVDRQRGEEQLPVGTFSLQKPVAKAEFPLLITMVPLSKGIPAEVADKKFYLTIQPQVEKKGYATLALHFPPGLENEPITLRVDDREMPYPVEKQELSSGIHHLQVLSPAFKEINATFAVESGKSSVVDIHLEESISQLSIDAPSAAELYLDGEKLPDSLVFPIPIDEGSHLVLAKIADRNISKKFTVQKGKHYHLSIIFDIIINEN